MILVGVASYCFSFVPAVATPPLAADPCEVLAALLAELVELDELDEPHAANATATATATASAAR
jgi:hypothetical protein